MKNSLIPVLGMAVMAGVVAHAQSINVTYQGGTGASVPKMVDSSSQPLADTDPINGLTVRIGIFDIGYDVDANAGNLQGLASHWHLFGASNMQTFFGVLNGAFSATSSSSDISFNGQHIDLWVFKTSDNLSPNFTTFANVLEYGLFTRNSASNPWTFPNAGFVGNSINIDTSQIDHAFAGTIGANNLGLAPVPEPGSLAIFGLGIALVGFVGRRIRA